MKALRTVRISKEEDTGVIIRSQIAIPYSLICGPIEDVTYFWPDEKEVTCFYDEFGNGYHVLEPFAKVFDNWILALEQEQHKAITFSVQ